MLITQVSCFTAQVISSNVVLRWGFYRIIFKREIILVKYEPCSYAVLLWNFFSGIYEEPACNSNHLSHAVLLVGYGSEDGQDYWIIKNRSAQIRQNINTPVFIIKLYLTYRFLNFWFILVAGEAAGVKVVTWEWSGTAGTPVGLQAMPCIQFCRVDGLRKL